MNDDRINKYIAVAEELKNGRYNIQIPAESDNDDLGRLGKVLQDLASALERRYREIQKLDQITWDINAGLLLDEILENVYRDFREIIPYNRIGFSLLEDDGRIIRSHWAKSDQPKISLDVGYEAELEGSSLQQIMQTGRPRIINDLLEYARLKPNSDSTRLILEEGIRSSLTCPLIANGVPVGFIFFSSIELKTYAKIHIQNFMRIAGQLAVIVEKGRLVSELAEKKGAIEQQNVELVRLNTLKNDFLGIAAHDLRNPISYIQMSSGFLQETYKELTNEQLEQILDDITSQSKHMLALLNDLLDVTRIESGKLQLEPEAIDLHKFLATAIERHSQMAAPKDIRILLTDVPGGLVDADQTRLRQVIDNLLSNAVKYSPVGSTVTVSAKNEGSHWNIGVRDEGPGIKADEREKLFKHFSRLSARPTGGESSTGLGLAITRRIVQAHGGKIWVESTYGEGATFWFSLPVVKGD